MEIDTAMAGSQVDADFRFAFSDPESIGGLETEILPAKYRTGDAVGHDGRARLQIDVFRARDQQGVWADLAVCQLPGQALFADQDVGALAGHLAAGALCADRNQVGRPNEVGDIRIGRTAVQHFRRAELGDMASVHQGDFV